MDSSSRSSSLGLIILGLLIEEPMHAYRMQKLIKQRGKDRVVNVRRPTSVYQALERLQRLNFVKVRATVTTQSHPDRIVYEITKDGRKAAKQWLSELLTNVGMDFPDFPAAVSVLTMLTPQEARKSFEARVEKVTGELRKLVVERKAAGNLPRLFLLDDALRAILLKAERKWLQAVIADLISGSLSWDDKWIREVAAKFTPADLGKND